MQNYYKHLHLLFKRFALILILFTISRLLFLFINLNYFNDLSTFQIIKALLNGLRFDISAICYFNVLFFFLHIIPGEFKNHKYYQRTLFILFIVVNSIILASNIIDIAYFKFTNKRTTFDVFYLIGLGSDFMILLPQFLKDYWYLIFLFLVHVFCLYYFYPYLKKTSLVPTNHKLTFKTLSKQLIFTLSLSVIIFIGGRGSLELKPLRIISASKYINANYIPLVLNTPFSILRTSGKQELKKKNYFNKEELVQWYNPKKEPGNSPERIDNVVIFILESFSSKYIGYLNNNESHTPFLDSLMKQSLVFTNSYANGKKSIEALPAIIASIPTLMNNPYISSSFASNQIYSLPAILNYKGYHTSFFHGGTNGTMGFDKFSQLAGFKHYYGRTEYDNEDDYDGNWGIYDEPFLNYFANKLSEFKKPFFTCFFTLSSHHPFPIPEKYKSKFNNSSSPIINSIEYTDFALETFFKKISKAKWFNNTLFVFTADHTAGNIDKNYKPDLATYEIPLFFFHPNNEDIKGVSKTIVQQIDIMPSILDYLGYKNPYLSFGNSVFNDSAEHFAINYLNQVYQFIYNGYVVKSNDEQLIGLYNIFNDKLMQNNLIGLNLPIENELEFKLKAIIQSYNNSLIENRLTIK